MTKLFLAKLVIFWPWREP